MRLFVAVDLPDAVRASAAVAAEQIREHLARATLRSRVTWVSPAALHLTLVFLGEVDEASAAQAIDGLQAPLSLTPFGLGLGSAGMFPPSGRPRVVWLGVTEGASALTSVRAAIEQRLSGVPYRRETRPFSPHLTLGRFREGGTVDERRAVEQAGVSAQGRADVDHVTLYRSRLSPRGPEYTALAQTRLTSEADA